jgi:acetyl esterase/lipase
METTKVLKKRAEQGDPAAFLRTQIMRCASLALCLAATLASGVNAQVSSPNATRQSDVIYGRKFGVALTMEVFRPASRNGIGILWVVSSSGRSSREQTLSDSFERRIAPLLERGYTVFAVIHGSAPVFNLQDQVADVRRAVRFVRQRAPDFGIDGDRLGISGSSAGGLLALIVAMDPQDGNPASDDRVERVSSRLQAVGCFFPPTDFTNFGAPSADILDRMQGQGGEIDPTFQFHQLDARTGARRPVTAREDVLRMLRDFSPATHVSSAAPPTILIHGEQDKAVPVQQSRWLVERLSQAKVPTRLVVREGAGHAYLGWEADAALLADWFGEHLRRVH